MLDGRDEWLGTPTVVFFRGSAGCGFFGSLGDSSLLLLWEVGGVFVAARGGLKFAWMGVELRGCAPKCF